jgi:hypothetical protein
MTYPDLEHRSPDSLRPSARNARTHSKKQIRQTARGIEEFGFTNPILIGTTTTSSQATVVSRQPSCCAFPPSRPSGSPTSPPPSAAPKVLADNKPAINAGLDREILVIELQALIGLGFDLGIAGFSAADIDVVLEDARDASPASPADPEEAPPPSSTGKAVTRHVWQLGRDRLICGDARDPATFQALIGRERTHLVFTDPP